MNLVNNNISPLPFYDNLALQNHRKDYAFGQVYPLITHRDMLLPFQIVLPAKGRVPVLLANAWLHNVSTGEEVNVLRSLNEGGLKINRYQDSGFSVLVYPGTLPVPEIKHEGQYFLRLSFNGMSNLYSEVTDLYSDIFTVTNTISDYLLIEYGNSYSLELKNGIVDFSDNFKFRCYLNTQIGRPEYVFEEEATERGGYTFVESQISKKIYRFTFLAPEYLCDALRIVRLCDYKKITSKLQEYDPITFSMEPEWQTQGDLAAVQCEFETDNVIANIGGYELRPLGGDFSDKDFTNDYKITE